MLTDAQIANEPRCPWRACILAENGSFADVIRTGLANIFASATITTDMGGGQNCDIGFRYKSLAWADDSEVVSAYTGETLLRILDAHYRGALLACSYLLPNQPLGAKLDQQRTQYRKLSTPPAGGISKEDLKELVQTAVFSATQAKDIAAPALSPQSDIDLPKTGLSQKPDDFALVIGIEKYSNDLPDAQFAERDAAAAKNHLLALGYPERNIKLLTGQRATGTSLASYIEDWLPRMAKPDSTVFFYFSGHGAPSEAGQAYIVAWDGNPNFLEKSAYPLKKLYAQLGSLKAKQVIVALDSCFSGTGGRSILAEGTRPLVNQVDTSVGSGGKITLFAAASPKEVTATLKEQGHGIFTYYFLKGLGGEAKGKDGSITAQGLYQYLKPKVQDAASRQNRDQTPVLEGAAESEITRFK